MRRPSPDEFAPYYAMYIDRVPDGDIVSYLGDQASRLGAVYDAIPADRGHYRYAPGKWSLNELIGHVNDVERMFCGRALAFARRDPTPYPAMEQDAWVDAAGADRLETAVLAAEFQAIRTATLAFFRTLTPQQWNCRGVASGREFSVSAIAWILAGHADHHAQVLGVRYLERTE